jgi:hypothetical protein
VVTTDLVVAQGKTVLIEPGTVFLFNGFTGIKVYGTLLARGSKTRPVVFTSVNDRAYNPLSGVDPAPYDWNGIHVLEDGAGTHLAYALISYSVYGIMSVTRYIRLGPTVFRFNGRSDFTVGGEVHEVGDEPYEYSLTVEQAAGDGIPLTILRDPNAPRRNIARYAGLTAAVAGGIAAVIYSGEFGVSLRRFDTLSSTNPENLAAHSSDRWRRQRKKTLTDMALMLGGYAVMAAGGVGFAWSFTF